MRLAKRDEFQAVKVLIEKLIATSSQDRLRSVAGFSNADRETLLMVAASQGQEDVGTLLLEIGADPNTLGPNNKTALDFATDAGYFGFSQQLLQAGANPSKSQLFKKIFSNSREYYGESSEASDHITRPSGIRSASLSPLGRAAFEGDTPKIKEMLGGGVSGPGGFDTEEGAETGLTAFLLASMVYNKEIMSLILSYGGNINATSKHGWTGLMLAAKRDDHECIRFLLSNGAEVNHHSPDRWTALAEATSKGSIAIMETLLKAGADPEIRSQHDWTPLMHAAYRGDANAVRLLLKFGASFEGISARDETVMLLAAAHGSASVVKLLLDSGCAPESEWSKVRNIMTEGEGESELNQQQRIERAFRVGWTPLMVACQTGSLQVVMLLLDAGANPEPKSPLFKTALEIARENGRTDVMNYLTQRLKTD